MINISLLGLLSMVSAIGQQVEAQTTAEIVAPAARLEIALTILDRIDQANRSGDKEKVSKLVKQLKMELRDCQSDLEEKNSVRGPSKVERHTVAVKYRVDPALLRMSDVWLGVIPLLAPDQLWLQGAAVLTPSGQRVVYVGLAGPLRMKEKFQIVLLSVPEGKYPAPVAIKTSELKKQNVKILASTFVERLK